MSSSGYLDINGGKLYYEVAGQGRAVVLIHAGIADSRMWEPQFAAFAEHFRVVRYDARGYGKTSSENVEFSNRQDIIDLLDHLGIEQAVLIGVSRGGQIAVDCALEFPQRVWALVPVCAGLSGFDYYAYADPLETQRFEEIEALYETHDYERIANLEVAAWVDGFYRDGAADPLVRNAVHRMIRENYEQHGDDEYSKVITLVPPAAGRLDEIAIPTLVIIGSIDTKDTRAIADTLTAGIQGARKVEFESAAHLPSMEQPERFNEIVLNFLRSL